MIPDWLFFLGFTLLAIIIQAIFALFEMGCVSFNKVRLQYYVSMGKKRALWLDFLLKRPSRLFGTTLIGINSALQIGSECSRRFYESIHLDPDWAPLSQVLLVVVFGELAPLFAARRHPEQVALFCAPFMIAIARFFAPLIWVFGALSNTIHYLMGKAKEVPLFLSREEVKMAFEETEESESELTGIVGQIFQLKHQTAKELMVPLSHAQMISSWNTLSEVRHHLSVHYEPFILIYHRIHSNIVSIAYLSDLLRCSEGRRVIECGRSPWFVTENASILNILEQFRRNNQKVAIVLDSSGQPLGLLTFDQILLQIFGKEESSSEEEIPSFHIERTLLGEMKVEEFNRQFQADLPHLPEENLSDLLTKELDHSPVKGETIRIEPFIFTVLEPSLTGVKVLSVYTRST
jgi:putative hemolysin